MSTVSTAEMARHVKDLCCRYKIRIAWSSYGGAAFRIPRYIRIRSVRSVITYAIALHEIGHIVGRGRSAPRLESEANGWVWALKNALPGTVNRSFRKKVKRSLNSYLAWAQGRRARVEDRLYSRPSAQIHALRTAPKVPTQDHIFWTLLQNGALPSIESLRRK